MTPRLKSGTFVAILVFALTLVGMIVSGGPRTNANGPYQSALSSIGVATAEAAHCANRSCTFASPGYTCSESSGSRCRLSGGTCTTVSCGGPQ